MPLQPTLRTPRLFLRSFNLADAPAVYALVRAREIADTTLSIPHPYEKEAADTWISSHLEMFNKGVSAHYAIIVQEIGVLVGAIGLSIQPVHSCAEIGYWVGVPYWGCGYCTEAVAAVLEYAFHERELNRIYAVHFKRNPASGRVMQKNGMIYEGCLRQHVQKWGTYEDLMHYGILRDEWQIRQVEGKPGQRLP